MLEDLFSGCLESFPGFQVPFYLSTANRLRCRWRFAKAKFAHGLWWFLAMPRYRTLSEPKMRFTMRKICSTLARTLDLFLFLAVSSLKCNGVEGLVPVFHEVEVW